MLSLRWATRSLSQINANCGVDSIIVRVILSRTARSPDIAPGGQSDAVVKSVWLRGVSINESLNQNIAPTRKRMILSIVARTYVARNRTGVRASSLNSAHLGVGFEYQSLRHCPGRRMRIALVWAMIRIDTGRGSS